MAAPIANAASELLGDLPARLREAAAERSSVRQARPSTDLPRLAGGARFRLGAFVAHRQRFVPAGLVAFLVLVAAVSALPVGTPATVSAGTRPSQGPRLEVVGLHAPEPDLAAAAAQGDVGASVDTSFTNTSGGGRALVDATGLLKTYTVQTGDTAVDIAAKFGISVDTLYWANRSILKDPQSIWPGQVLAIPPVNGLIITVDENDTLESLAAEYGVSTQAIVEANNLSDPILITGDTLIIPGARGEAMPTPTPAPTPQPTQRTTTTTTAKTTVTKTTTTQATTPYTGGRLLWPLVGGYISQRFWSGHPALDIAAPYGTTVRAAAAGTVVFAGDRGYYGGGYVVWINHGGLYTTYNHMSRWTVSAGQSVAAGQTVGYVGLTGITTGPHLHFEVWTVKPWSYGTTYGTQNPCYYLGC